jgi:hypothetical protein
MEKAIALLHESFKIAQKQKAKPAKANQEI